MNTTYVKAGAALVGGVVALTLISQHPVQIVVIAVAAAVFIYADKIVTQ